MSIERGSIWTRLLALLAQLFDQVVAPLFIPVVQRGLVPDFILRIAIQWMLHDRLFQCRTATLEGQMQRKQEHIQQLKNSPIAKNTKDANAQHYEVPAQLYELVLGPRLKYSCGYWPRGVESLAASEDAALAQVCARAGIQDGHTILDLGCGWGSFALWAAAHYPHSSVEAISNSESQRRFIMDSANKQGLKNLQVFTADINNFKPPSTERYDRIVSIEMFEHMKNYSKLLRRVSQWLVPGGKLFVHIFTHKDFAYHFDEGWMAENFFTGGQMPSADLLLYFQDDLTIKNMWAMDGTHYARTCEEWLRKLDQNKKFAIEVLRAGYKCKSYSEAYKRYIDWRLFYLACAVMFSYKNGQEWGVNHYLFERKTTTQDHLAAVNY